MLAVVLIAALLLSSQCYARCLAYTQPAPHASTCHHHPEENRGPGNTCPHEHSNLFSPANSVDLSKLANFDFAPSLGLLCMGPAQAIGIQPVTDILNRTQHHNYPGISVLALLSTFRV
jgi:hypothetical protein